MSYEFMLDEYTTESLEKELERRKIAAAQNLCDYCGRPKGIYPPCKFPVRHAVN